MRSDATSGLLDAASLQKSVGNRASSQLLGHDLSGGRTLDGRLRTDAERLLGRDLSHVRIHAGDREPNSADKLGTPAFTFGSHIMFGTGRFSTETTQGRQVLFHELAHTAQQPRPSETIPQEPIPIGQRGDPLETEAAAAGAALAADRPASLRAGLFQRGSPVIRRYEAGEHVQLGETGISVVVQGHTISYGEMIALGDFFASPEDVQKAPWAVIAKLLELIKRDREFLTGVPGAKKVTEDEWQKATLGLPKGKRYLDLAAKNVTHFAVENKKAWEKLHRQALRLAQKGNMDDALAVNAFGDHFLTDAFAAGHLIEKDVVAKQAKARLKKADPKEFSHDVAVAILANSDARSVLTQYEVRPSPFRIGSWRAMDEDSLGDLIETIRKYQSAYFYSTFAKTVHDELNAAISHGKGVQVRNKRGDELGPGGIGPPFWALSGDKTLSQSPQTRDVAKRAVAESRQQVSAAKGVKKLDYDALAARVWENVPEPTAEGKRQIEETQSRLTNPEDATAIAAYAQVAIDGRVALVEELERRKFLRKLPSASGVAGAHPPKRAVATWAGEFSTDNYEANKPGKQEIGAKITLRFKPGDKVDSTLFGMIQLATSTLAGKVHLINPTISARSIPAGQPGEGGHIDQLQQYPNPLYATGPAGARDRLQDTPTPHPTDWGFHGWHYVDRAGRPHSHDAVLIDKTNLGDPRSANSSQIFETTVMAVTGVQTGAYYGSVRWGWQSDAHNNFSMLPLTRVSNDVPSAVFASAVPLWNKVPTSTGRATIPFKAATAAYTKVANASLVSDPTKPKDIVVPKIAKNTRLEITETGPAWSKVTLVAGTSIGKVGWIPSGSLSSTITP